MTTGIAIIRSVETFLCEKKKTEKICHHEIYLKRMASGNFLNRKETIKESLILRKEERISVREKYE